MKRKANIILVAILATHLFILLIQKFTGWPEMTFWPYLMLKGWLPYKDIAIAHNPLLLLFLSGFYAIFGVGLAQLKIFTYLTILSIDIVLYLVVRKLWNEKTAVFSLAAYIFLQMFYEGNGLWFDLFLTIPIILSFYFLQKKNYLWTAIFWAIAFMVKQTAVWFLFPIALNTISTFKGTTLQVSDPGSPTRRGIYCKVIKNGFVAEFVLGVVVVFVPTFLIILGLGILQPYVFWAYEFGTGILPTSSGQVVLPGTRQLIVSFLPFSILLLIPFTKKLRTTLVFTTWAIFGVMGAFPRWELFHFQPALPFLAIVFAIIIVDYKKHIQLLKLGLIGLLIFIVLLFSRNFIRNFGTENRFYEPGVIEMGNYIRDNTGSNQKIYVLNAWDNLYVLSDTVPATKPWVPHLQWYMQLPGVQENIVSDLKKEKPKMIVMKPFTTTGLSSYQPEEIVEFILGNYQQKDTIDGYLLLTPAK